VSTLGILGAGKLGTVLARLAVAAGYDVHVAASGDPAAIRPILDVLSPGANAGWAAEVARAADLLIVAVPLSRIHNLPAAEMTGKIVIDATNYWPPTDGTLAEFTSTPSSLIVAATLPGASVVKSLSHVGYHELDRDARPADAPDRHAIAVAGDDPAAVQAASQLVDRIGFDPLVLPDGISAGSTFSPGTPAFGESVDQARLFELLRHRDDR
jgi:8-hydroxy-5-deazaflavin:NADPH oxidoreductase